MKSKVHPRYKTKYRVANWAAYNQALVRRSDVRRCCTNPHWLDPEGLDETAEAKFHWIATAGAGSDYTIGRVTVCGKGGLAVADIANSVTDIDFFRDIPPMRLEFPILSLHPGLRQRCVAPDVWPTLSRA